MAPHAEPPGSASKTPGRAIDSPSKHHHHSMPSTPMSAAKAKDARGLANLPEKPPPSAFGDSRGGYMNNFFTTRTSEEENAPGGETVNKQKHSLGGGPPLGPKAEQVSNPVSSHPSRGHGRWSLASSWRPSYKTNRRDERSLRAPKLTRRSKWADKNKAKKGDVGSASSRHDPRQSAASKAGHDSTPLSKRDDAVGPFSTPERNNKRGHVAGPFWTPEKNNKRDNIAGPLSTPEKNNKGDNIVGLLSTPEKNNKRDNIAGPLSTPEKNNDRGNIVAPFSTPKTKKYYAIGHANDGSPGGPAGRCVKTSYRNAIKMIAALSPRATKEGDDKAKMTPTKAKDGEGQLNFQNKDEGKMSSSSGDVANASAPSETNDLPSTPRSENNKAKTTPMKTNGGLQMENKGRGQVHVSVSPKVFVDASVPGGIGVGPNMPKNGSKTTMTSNNMKKQDAKKNDEGDKTTKNDQGDKSKKNDQGDKSKTNDQGDKSTKNDQGEKTHKNDEGHKANKNNEMSVKIKKENEASDSAKKTTATNGKAKASTSSGEILGLKPSVAIKAENATAAPRLPLKPAAAAAVAASAARKAAASPDTRGSGTNNDGREPLSERVRHLEDAEERHRSRRGVLAADNRRLKLELSSLEEEFANEQEKTARMDKMHAALQQLRQQTVEKLDDAKKKLAATKDKLAATTSELTAERARVAGLRFAAQRDSEERARAAEATEFELRKFRTALVAAFRLLPSLQDMITFRGILERTERHLREKVAREGTQQSAAPMASDGVSPSASASKPGAVANPSPAAGRAGKRSEATGSKTVMPSATPTGQKQGLKRDRQVSPLVARGGGGLPGLPDAKRRRET